MHFNSSMVRLKVVKLYFLLNNIQLFQFQYGAIEGLASNLLNSNSAYFNSSMVRLKVFALQS